MAGEIIDGKRTLIERHGKEFELPNQHRVRLIEGVGEDARRLWVTLDTPGEGSLFEVPEVEERGDAVVVHLGAELGRHGPAYWLGEGHSEVSRTRGYPFPSA